MGLKARDAILYLDFGVKYFFEKSFLTMNLGITGAAVAATVTEARLNLLAVCLVKKRPKFNTLAVRR